MYMYVRVCVRMYACTCASVHMCRMTYVISSFLFYYLLLRSHYSFPFFALFFRLCVPKDDLTMLYPVSETDLYLG